MTYPTLSAKSATAYIAAKQANEDIDLEGIIFYRDSTDNFSDSDAKVLVQKIEDLRKQFPETIKKGSRHASEFEAKAAPIVHENVPEGAYCADPEFWIWLANMHFDQIIAWRYEGKFAPANLGIGAATENFVYRLWLRAELVIDQARQDKYELAKKGGSVDFWRSHLFRQSYANARPFARALLRYQYPTDDDKPRLDTLGIRDLAKRLARLKSNLFMACLAEDEALSLIQSEAQLLVGSAKAT